jgi:adenylate cyclase, class 2
MSGSGEKREVEIKLLLASAEQGRGLLRRAGFRVRRRRVFECNALFDTPEGSLGARGVLLRLRHAGRRTLLTFKGLAAEGKYKSRQEIETVIPDSEAFEAILGGLGFVTTFRYEKYRTEYGGADNRGVVTLDETPIGVYLELEGTPGWIRRTARLLGFAEGHYITDSYGGLYSSFCRRKGIPLRDMVFAPQNARRGKRNSIASAVDRCYSH